MVNGPDNKGYLVQVGDKVLDGEVIRITPSSVVFRQEVNDPTRIERFREVVKELSPEASEEVGAGGVQAAARGGCEMVKVGSMRRAKRILLIAGMLVLSVSGAGASFWHAHKAKRSAGRRRGRRRGMSLTAIEIELGSTARLILRTSGTPASTPPTARSPMSSSSISPARRRRRRWRFPPPCRRPSPRSPPKK